VRDLRDLPIRYSKTHIKYHVLKTLIQDYPYFKSCDELITHIPDYRNHSFVNRRRLIMYLNELFKEGLLIKREGDPGRNILTTFQLKLEKESRDG